ncbi:MSHA biogenesis protein MshD [Bacterioplanes sanyensis]|uniref:MSHA biogenesis protein MshD n=1 Tax=Bacterioplanes sanyensis TaxID=1249553 RepID=A0A222FDL4_9GAMM|nr:type II secretion system protein [Bacterioplanes sanyensis]ASP37175.1 MSHA biogenesis protein MshD [Bacterioplanes sanyensis]
MLASKIQRGVTLVELVITIVIISIALVASIASFSVITGRSANAMVQSRALELGQLYLDEILARRFDEGSDPTGIPPYTGACRITDDGESRGQFDDVDDFHNLNDDPPALIDLPADTDYNGYVVDVRVSCDSGVGSNGDAKLITVTVTAPNGSQSRFSVYRGNF